MQLIVITHPDFFPGEAAILNELFAEGLKICHVRKPEATALSVGRLLDGIDSAYRNRVALHQHHELAKKYGINRLHVKTMGIDTDYIYSTSLHSVSNLPTAFNYAFFSPVFDSISKPGYQAVVGTDFHLGKQPMPIIALGGIDSSNIEKVKTMNFDGAAVLGALWTAPQNAVEQFKQLQDLCARM